MLRKLAALDPRQRVARQLLSVHPERFTFLDHAHGFAAALAERYGA